MIKTNKDNKVAKNLLNLPNIRSRNRTTVQFLIKKDKNLLDQPVI